MGSVFGKIDVETPKFKLVQSTSDYEIRMYSPSVVAQVTYEYGDPSQTGGNRNRDSGFSILAKYIGVLGQPQNTKPEKISMTAPVVTLNEEDEKKKNMVVTMQFVLPSKYTKAEEAPRPIDERVVIREEGERKYGVVSFSGVATDNVVHEKVKKVKECLERDGYKVIGEFLLARYNPPWTLPVFRTNEIMIPIE